MLKDELVIEYNIAHEFPQQNSTVELKRSLETSRPNASTNDTAESMMNADPAATETFGGAGKRGESGRADMDVAGAHICKGNTSETPNTMSNTAGHRQVTTDCAPLRIDEK
jgi:hypothetical protein